MLAPAMGFRLCWANILPLTDTLKALSKKKIVLGNWPDSSDPVVGGELGS